MIKQSLIYYLLFIRKIISKIFLFKMACYMIGYKLIDSNYLFINNIWFFATFKKNSKFLFMQIFDLLIVLGYRNQLQNWDPPYQRIVRNHMLVFDKNKLLHTWTWVTTRDR